MIEYEYQDKLVFKSFLTVMLRAESSSMKSVELNELLIR